MTVSGRITWSLCLLGLGAAANAADSASPSPSLTPSTTAALAPLPAAAPAVAMAPDPSRARMAAPSRPQASPPSDWSWRISLGAGLARERLHYAASAQPASPVPSGYDAASASASPSASCATAELAISALHGLPRRAGASGLVYGYELTLTSYAPTRVALPVVDADQSSFTRNGTSFTSTLSLQAIGLGMPVGWAWQAGPRWSWNALGSAHLGLMHLRYTSGENEVDGRNAPLDLYANDLLSLAYDVGAQLGFSYQARPGWSVAADLGCRYGQSLSGRTDDQVVYYQGAANAQPGSYAERLRISTTAAYLMLGVGGSF